MTKRKHRGSIARMRLDEPPQQSWVFAVSSHVHPASYGKRKKRVTRSDPWTREDFDVREKLGQGRFGTVYKAAYERNDEPNKENLSTTPLLRQGSNVALKRFSKHDIQSAQKQGDFCAASICNEINIHSHLQHPNIVSMIGFFDSPSSICMVLEYAPNRSIDAENLELLSPSERLSRAQCILAQICSAIDYLHNLSIAHRDIKPENILCFHEATFKLCDFGWATWFKIGHYHKTLCGTPEFVPPELLHDTDGYAPEYVDPWALGVLTIELVETKTPFITEAQKTSIVFDKNAMFDCIRNFKGDPVKDRKADPSYRDFVNRLMQVEPTNRMTAGEALQHKFLSSGRSTLLSIQSPPTVAQRCELFEQTAP